MSVLVALQNAASATFVQAAISPVTYDDPAHIYDDGLEYDSAGVSWSATVTVAVGGFTSTATWTQGPASWSATVTESFTSTASFAQATATWSATASEAFTATASWSQAAASWTATAAQDFASAASWAQAAASWDALAAATGTSPSDFTADWQQDAATWEAMADTPIVGGAGRGPNVGLGWIRDLKKPETLPLRERIVMRAEFIQAPASWAAEMDTYDPDLLALLLDEPALIGAR